MSPESATVSIPQVALAALNRVSEYLAQAENAIPKRRPINPALGDLVDTGTWHRLSEMLPEETEQYKEGAICVGEPENISSARWEPAYITGKASLAEVRPSDPNLGTRHGNYLGHIFYRVAGDLALDWASAEENKDTTRTFQVVLGGGIGSSIEGQRISKVSHSTARSLLKHATGWAGNDLSECLSAVYQTRSTITL